MAVDFPELAGKNFQAINAVGTPMSVPSLAAPRTANPYICDQNNGYTSSWTGNTPPNCTSTGIFRRAYSVPNTEAAAAYIQLPSSADSEVILPTGGPDFGFIYIEGWPGPKTGDSEGGVAYAAMSDTYFPYVATINPNQPQTEVSYSIPSHTSLYIRVGAVSDPSMFTTLPTGSTPESCGTGCLALTVVFPEGQCPVGAPLNNGLCTDVERIAANGWSGNCCIFGRMTAVATPKDDFINPNSYLFSNIAWSRAVTDFKVPGPQATPFAYAGSQSYPNSPNFVEVSGQSSVMENDTLYVPTSY